MYLDDLAHRIMAFVDEREMPVADDTASLFRLYALLLLAKGADTTAEDVHNAWAAWMAGRQSDHEALRPFQELDEETQRADLAFLAAIRRVAAEL